MQPWSPIENTIILTDLLRPSPPSNEQQSDDYVKQEPPFAPYRPSIELPPLLPPRTPMLPAFSDVLRTTTPHHFQHENLENNTEMNLQNAVGSGIDCSDIMTFPTAFTNATSIELVSPNLQTMSSPYVTVDGNMTPPERVRTRVHPIDNSMPSRQEVSARPASRTCRFTNCTQYVVDHGLCVRHGGGKRCMTEGCTARAKHFNRCWRHGGSIECKAPECPNRAKSRGFCWSHGGGTKCKVGECEKIAISSGLCWAHGGGKRCIVSGCRKQAYERTCNYCNSHFQQYQQTVIQLATSTA